METIKTEDSNVENTTIPGSENAQTETTKDYVPLEHVNSANRQEATKQFIVEQAEKSTVENQNLVNLVKANREVEITDEDKSAFLESVINGTRFYAHVNLFGGKVRVKFRSRTLAETEAIMSYLHRQGILGKLFTKADVSDTLLTALLVAQVEEVGDVTYKEMSKPYKYVETAASYEEPGWLADLEMWRNKPEHLTSALGDALVDFEAKYWKMIAASKDENFWNPG